MNVPQLAGPHVVCHQRELVFPNMIGVRAHEVMRRPHVRVHDLGVGVRTAQDLDLQIAFWRAELFKKFEPVLLLRA